MNAITKSAGVASTELTVPAPHSGASLYRASSTDAAPACAATSSSQRLAISKDEMVCVRRRLAGDRHRSRLCRLVW